MRRKLVGLSLLWGASLGWSVLAADFNGDGRPDPFIFRGDSGLWAIREITRCYFGRAGDIPVPGSCAGAAAACPAVFRPSNGLWAIRGLTRFYFGRDGDLPFFTSSSAAVFRPSAGLWAVRNLTRYYFGRGGDAPLFSDVDGDGEDDPGVFRLESGLWAFRGLTRFYHGSFGELPFPGDYNGDGTAEAAVYRKSTGRWMVRGQTRLYFGRNPDRPVSNDYDGDGTVEPAIFRPSAGLWVICGKTRFYYGRSGDLPGGDHPPFGFDPALANSLQDNMEETLAGTECPGSVLMVRRADGSVWFGSAGVAVAYIPGNTDGQSIRGAEWTGEPSDPDRHYRIASTTKSFTATLVLIMKDRGLLSLGHTVGHWLPDSGIPNAEVITLKDLLGMSSGLFNYSEDPSFAVAILTDPLRKWTPQELVDIANAHGPIGPPGEYYYNNTNFAILGMVAERAGGSPYRDLVDELILSPLGLNETSVPAPDDVLLPPPAAHGYRYDDEAGGWRDYGIATGTFMYSGGNIISTLRDLSLWIGHLTAGTLLTPGSRTEMFTFADTGTPGYWYGLGLKKYLLPSGRYITGHSGEGIGYHSSVYRVDNGDSLVALTNGNSPISGIANSADEILFRAAGLLDR